MKRYGAGFWAFNHDLHSAILRRRGLNHEDLRVWLALGALTLGFQKEKDIVSAGQIGEFSGVDRCNVHRALRKLQAMDLVGKRTITPRKVERWIIPPDSLSADTKGSVKGSGGADTLQDSKLLPSREKESPREPPWVTGEEATLTAKEQVEKYAAVVWQSGDLIEVRCLRKKPKASRLLWKEAGELGAEMDRLAKCNGQGFNVYAGILPRKVKGAKTDAGCLPGLAVWADFDGVDPREAWRTATAAGLPDPSMAVNSGHGAHLFWALTEPADPAAISGLVADMAALLDADPTVRNPSRILRLPGFKNWKEPVADAVLLYADPAQRYAFDDLRAAVPVPPQAQASCPDAPHGTATRASVLPEDKAHLIQRAQNYVKKIPGAREGGRNPQAYRAAAALRQDFGLNGEGWPLFLEWNGKNSPPLPEPELWQVWENVGKYAKHPAGAKARARGVPEAEPSEHRSDRT